MKIIFTLALVAIVGGIIYFVTQSKDVAPKTDNPVVQESSNSNVLEAKVEAVGVIPIEHATMVVTFGDVVVYVDPIGGAQAFSGKPPATIVLVTDIHGDHFSTTTLTEVVGGQTTLIVPQAVKDKLPEALAAKALVMANNDMINVGNIIIAAVPMYNLPEAADSPHAKGRGNGYLVTGNDTRVYIAGDTGPIPEMKALTDIDIAFIPMNLPYTMSVEDAAKAVLAFAPKKVIPYHYRQPDGLADVQKFKSLIEAGNTEINVELLDWYPKP